MKSKLSKEQKIENLKFLTDILSYIIAECYILKEEYSQFNRIDSLQFQKKLIEKTNQIIKNEIFINIQ